MDARREGDPSAVKNATTAERKSDREVVVTRMFDAPPRIVFEAWTTPALIQRWWIPRSIDMSFVSCELDVRTGGSYRFVFRMAGAEPMAFFGKYLEVTPPSRLVWTNEESGDAGAVSTLTLEEKGGRTLLVMRDLYPSKEALDAAIAAMGLTGMEEPFSQLDELLVTLGASAGRS